MLQLTKEAVSTYLNNPIDFDHAVHDKRGGVVLLVEQGNVWTVVDHINKWGTSIRGAFTFNGIP